MAAARPSYSIVIVTFGKREVTERCLASLEDAFGDRLGRDVEVVLVDNNSPDDTAELLRSWEDRATVILLDENRNYAGGNNIGAHAARGEVLVLLNNDTEVPAGALDLLTEQAREEGVGIAGCRLLYPDGTIQHGGCAWWRSPDGMMRNFHLFRHEAGDLPAACATFDCDVVTAACIAIRRELFLELGGFDEAFVNGWEDTDLCVRARIAGHRVVYRGDVAVIHAEGASRGRAPAAIENERLFAARYGHMVQEDTERLAAQFDATGPLMDLALHPAETPEGAEVSVEGEVTGLAPESAEARALLTGLQALQMPAATRDWRPATLVPRFTEPEWAPLARARTVPVRRDALRVQAPVGRLVDTEVHDRAILRLAELPAYDISGAAAVWAATSTLADELVAAGLERERVSVLRPLVPELPIGLGGGGVLAVLPAHDRERCGEILFALAELPAPVRVRLLPTAATEPLAALAAELFPRGEMLAPIASEHRFALLAGECDVVISLDARDRFERRALVAAAAGATVIHLPGGSAEEILGSRFAYQGSSVVLQDAVTAPLPRAEIAQRVRDVCGHSALVRLRELVECAQRQAACRTRPALAPA